jgi:hypothetical protein
MEATMDIYDFRVLAGLARPRSVGVPTEEEPGMPDRRGVPASPVLGNHCRAGESSIPVALAVQREVE